MNKDSNTLLLVGDLSVDLVKCISDRLRPLHPDVILLCSEPSRDAHAIILDDVLATAAAIAAVLNFLINAAKAWRESRRGIFKSC